MSTQRVRAGGRRATRPAPGWISLGLLFLLGCSDGPPPYQSADRYYFQNDPSKVIAAYAPAMTDTGKNALIGVNKLLSAAMLEGAWLNARAYAVRASTLVNIFLAGEPGERDALSVFGQEKDKPFKGEPYERLMVDYYLGVIRFMERDYEGALAAFRSAMNNDRGTFLLPVVPEEAKKGGGNTQRYIYQDTYGLLQFLAARCYQRLGEPEEAQKSLARAQASHPALAEFFEAGFDPDNNVLVLIEAGEAPVKIRTGPAGAILGYHPGVLNSVDDVSLGDHKLALALSEDLYYHATHLGGREVDKLNKDKAARQQALQLAGFAARTAGFATVLAGAASGNRNVEAAGWALILLGIGTGILTNVLIDPRADIRAWTLLPGQVFLAFGSVPPGPNYALRIAAHDPGDLSQVWTGVSVNTEANLYWIRLLPGRKGGPWPPMPPAEEADRQSLVKFIR
jgi:tetratricopeptide (TPR) repeat protein